MDGSRRILLITQSLGPGGAERQVAHLARGLSTLGARVTLLCLGEASGDVTGLERAGVRVRALGAVSPRLRARAMARIVAFARRSDAVVCSSWDATFWGRVAAILARRPAIVVEHAVDRSLQSSLAGRPRGRWIALHNRLLDPFTYATVACANAQLPVLRSEGVAPRKTVLIPNGVPVEELRRASERGAGRAALGIGADVVVLLHVARLAYVKNQRQTLAAVRRLREDGLDVEVVFAGDGEDRVALEEQAAGQPWAHLLGAREDVPALLGLADLAVLPSRSEAMPMVVAEALAVGVPVVATDVGDVGALLRRTGAGIAVAADDAGAFTEACRRLVADRGERARLAELARAAAAQFDDATMSRRYAALVDAAVAGRPPATTQADFPVPAREAQLDSRQAAAAARLPPGVRARNSAARAPDDVLVLAYHAISDDWDAVTTVTARQLRDQVDFLLARGYVGVTFERALTAPPVGRIFAITFDDAHRSVYTIGLPMLRAHGIPATVFVPTDHVGTGQPTGWEGFEADARGPHADDLVCMDWSELREAADHGWEIGSHTRSHPRLTTIPDGQLRDELEGSRELLEARLQRPCASLAYPYSDVDDRVVAAAHAAGYTRAVTIPVGGTYPLPLRWPRVGVFRSDSLRRFKLMTAPATRRFLISVTGNMTADAVRSAKSIVRGG